MQSFTLWTDGASGGKADSAGGWAFVLVHSSGLELCASGFDESTTNNRMELLAVIRGLQHVGDESAYVTVVTDSGYVKNGYETFLTKWKENGWVASTGKPVANQDLWELIDEVAARHDVRWRLVKGHVGPGAKTYSSLKLNRDCDQMAVRAKRSQTETLEYR